MPLPNDEIGFFRPATVTVDAQGLDSPNSRSFGKALVLTIKPKIAGQTVRYTTDNTQPTAQSPICDGPITLKDSAIVRAACFDGNNQRAGAIFRGEYQFEPLNIQVHGVSTQYSPRCCFRNRQRSTSPARISNEARCAYTLDGFDPVSSSTLYTAPIVIKRDTLVKARCFDAAGKAHGGVWTGSFINHDYEKNLTTGKPVTASGSQPNHPPEDAAWMATIVLGQSGWWGGDAPQWLQVDLQAVHKLDHVRVFTYWDDSRYYQYKIEVSVDGQQWTKVVDRSDNTSVSTPLGQLTTFAPTDARYVKITILKNKACNPAVHLEQLRVYEVP